jgi:hypothetical protein
MRTLLLEKKEPHTLQIADISQKLFDYQKQYADEKHKITTTLVNIDDEVLEVPYWWLHDNYNTHTNLHLPPGIKMIRVELENT